MDTPTEGNTVLHWAASFGSSEDVVKLFITHGADVNAKNANGAAPMHEVVKKKNGTIIRILLEAGADMNIVAEKGEFAGKCPQDIVRESEIDVKRGAILQEPYVFLLIRREDKRALASC